jgi:hypothetical protein
VVKLPLTDEGLIRDIDSKSLVQVAVQRDGVVVVHRPTYEKMDPKSRNALYVHEAFVRLVSQVNPKLIQEQGTAPIRKFNKLLFEHLYQTHFIPAKVLRDAFKELGIPNNLIR